MTPEMSSKFVTCYLWLLVIINVATFSVFLSAGEAFGALVSGSALTGAAGLLVMRAVEEETR